jgi:hypothetical protein
VTSLRRSSRRVLLFAAVSVLLAACGDLTKLADPQLQQIKETLDAQLPPGTPSSLVFQYVTARGYPIESAGRSDALRVIIRHIDQEKLKPVTARVTFYFDKNDKLVKTEIERTLNQNVIPPATAPPDTQSQPQSEPSSPPPSN